MPVVSLLSTGWQHFSSVPNTHPVTEDGEPWEGMIAEVQDTQRENTPATGEGLLQKRLELQVCAKIKFYTNRKLLFITKTAIVFVTQTRLCETGCSSSWVNSTGLFNFS